MLYYIVFFSRRRKGERGGEPYKGRGADAEKNFRRDGRPSRWEVYAMWLDVRGHLLHLRRKKNASFIWKNKKFHMGNGDSGVMES